MLKLGMIPDKINKVAAGIILLFHFGCKDLGIEPPPPPKHPREYTFRIDTISYPGSFQTMMRSIWANSVQNVYIVGHNSSASGEMWHFDGRKWTPVKLHILDGGPIRNIGSLSDIHGFAANNIFAVGDRIYVNPNPPPNALDSSLIIHYDGIRWNEHQTPAGRSLQTVWGSSPTDVWAGGTHGTLFHYDGSSWQKFPMPDSIWFADIVGSSANDVHAIAYTLGELGLNTYHYFQWDGKTWEIRDSFTESPFIDAKFGTNGITLIEKMVFTVGNGIFQRTVSGWTRVFGNRTTRFRDLCASNSASFFAIGNFSLAYHYNGKDWFQYMQLLDRGIHYSACWTDGRELFIVGTDDGGHKSFVAHGK